MSTSKTKEIYDPIHGFIKLTPLMQKIMYTWEFGRLYDLHQLGAAYYVYPSAVHKRSEHSLGVSHLAGIMAKSLIKSEEVVWEPHDATTAHTHERRIEIITKFHSDGKKSLVYISHDRFIELCRIAGLVHDIGHGPYSHLYDHHVKPHDEPEHEERGIEILTMMVSKYSLPITEDELNIIKTMIVPPESNLKYLWYYQIVANKVCDIDVDKIDYIQRDCFHTGLGFGGEWSRLLTMCKVRKFANNEQETIIWPAKLQDEIFQLFAARYRLHKHVCTHHTVKAYEYLIVDILKKARSQVDHFTDLTDSVVTCRLHSEFREIQEKIARKEIPILVGEKIIGESIEEGGVYPRRILDLIIDKFYIGLSSGSDNPLMNVPYEDWDGNIFTLDEKDMRLCQPTKHKETIVRMYTFSPGQMTEARKDWKENW